MWGLGLGLVEEGRGHSDLHGTTTLPETNMETQKGPYKDYSPSKGGLYGFPC